MKLCDTMHQLSRLVCLGGLGLVALGCSSDSDDDSDDPIVFEPAQFDPEPIVTHDALEAALKVARAEANGGLNFDMWATVVDRAGVVVAVAYTGAQEDDQWPGSRVISAQKANTANAFSLDNFALSSANLFAATQPGGGLYGLQESNPVDTVVAYGGEADDYGSVDDFMVGKKIGGVNVFGGGLAMYARNGNLIGALGVSGDTSCADHNIAWKLRDQLGFDVVPAGVAPSGTSGTTDNIIYDIVEGVSASGFGHPQCSDMATTIGNALPTSKPVSPRIPD
jgi:uncharacterized protein GlcG (DUF336 family)